MGVRIVGGFTLEENARMTNCRSIRMCDHSVCKGDEYVCSLVERSSSVVMGKDCMGSHTVPDELSLVDESICTYGPTECCVKGELS